MNFKKIQCSLLSPEHSTLTDVKINQNRFKGSGQDILVWRIQIPEVEPFDGFSVPCELKHFRFSGCLLIVACRPPLQKILGSRSRLPRLEVFTLELHSSSSLFFFVILIIPSCIVRIQSLPETGE